VKCYVRANAQLLEFRYYDAVLSQSSNVAGYRFFACTSHIRCRLNYCSYVTGLPPETPSIE
jgi:hypothetical protein